nr:DUF4012 domain-containing protein [Motilibacter aurantiacus]
MVGEGGAKDYLLAILNPAEMRASGGAPLTVATMRLDEGALSIPQKNATGSIRWPNALPKGPNDPSTPWVNPPLPWEPVADDPITPKLKGEAQGIPFVNSNVNPDFRVAGENMARAWEGGTGQKVDGVIALDIAAVRELLRSTGPVTSAAYGEVNDVNIVQRLLADAYYEQDDVARAGLNLALMTAVVDRLSQGEGLLDKVKALAAAAPSRHLQVWFRDPTAQQMAADNGFGGAVADPSSGDHIAVFAQNGNESKVDVFAQRTIDEVVRLQEDGSATVTRTITLRNTARAVLPESLNRKRGYRTAWSWVGLTHLLPEGAEVLTPPGRPAGAVGDAQTGVDQAGRPYWSQVVEVAPEGYATQVLEFRIPKAAEITDGGMRLTLTLDPDNGLNPVRSRTVVLPPAGWQAVAAPGVEVVSGQAVVNAVMVAQQTVQIPLVKGTAPAAGQTGQTGQPGVPAPDASLPVVPDPAATLDPGATPAAGTAGGTGVPDGAGVDGTGVPDGTAGLPADGAVVPRPR